jgi:hypothetical protein
MPWLRVNTEYSIQRVQNTMSTAYTAYCIIPRSTASRSQPVSHLLADYVGTQFSTVLQLQVNEWIEPPLPSCLPPKLPPPGWPRPCTHPISLDYGLQVHLHTLSITAFKCISTVTRLWPPSGSPILLDHSLQVYLHIPLITASMCISKLAWSRPPSAPPNSHDHTLQVYV